MAQEVPQKILGETGTNKLIALLKTTLENQQVNLTPGYGIKIENGVISLDIANGDGVDY